MIAAVESVAAHLQPGTLVALESTTYPGTTDEVVRPILEASGLVAGIDFNLAFSPERIDPGNQDFGPRNTPKVIGGHTENCTQAADFYGRFVDTVVKTKGTRSRNGQAVGEHLSTHQHRIGQRNGAILPRSEYRSVGRDRCSVDQTIRIPIIPARTWSVGIAFRSTLTIFPTMCARSWATPSASSSWRRINNSMPTYVARRVQDLLNSDSKAVRGASVLLLGVTYKPNIADVRESPATPLAKCLIAMGAHVSFHDPHVKNWTVAGRDLTSESDCGSVADADACVLLQNHRDYDVDAGDVVSPLSWTPVG